MYSYGGCKVNKNNHLTEFDCVNSCVKPKQKGLSKYYYFIFINIKCKINLLN